MLYIILAYSEPLKSSPRLFSTNQRPRVMATGLPPLLGDKSRLTALALFLASLRDGSNWGLCSSTKFMHVRVNFKFLNNLYNGKLKFTLITMNYNLSILLLFIVLRVKYRS